MPGAKVTVTFDLQTKSAIANKHGTWKVSLDLIFLLILILLIILIIFHRGRCVDEKAEST